MIDSEIVRAMINKDSYGFRSFAANRIGKIQEYTEKENWYWVEGNLNIADRTNRPLDMVAKVGLSSEWQKGSEFLQMLTEEWPIKSEARVSSLPEVKRSFVGTDSRVSSKFPWLDNEL